MKCQVGFTTINVSALARWEQVKISVVTGLYCIDTAGMCDLIHIEDAVIASYGQTHARTMDDGSWRICITVIVRSGCLKVTIANVAEAFR